MADPFFSLKELAETYGASVETFRAWIASGELQAINLSRNPSSKKPRFAVRQSALDSFFESRETSEAAEVRKQKRDRLRNKPFERLV